MEEFEEDTTEIRKKVGKICMELGKHKKKHKNSLITGIIIYLMICFIQIDLRLIIYQKILHK